MNFRYLICASDNFQIACIFSLLDKIVRFAMNFGYNLGTWAIILLHMPCFARLIDVKKLKMKPKPLKFSHNNSACIFRFHGHLFMNMKTVTLTKEKHFKDRKNCSVEFFNLPEGDMFVNIGKENEEIVDTKNLNDTHM